MPLPGGERTLRPTPGDDSSDALAGKRRRVRQGMLRRNRPGCRVCGSQVPASVAAAESLPGGRAHSWPATRSCFPATASAVLWVPAKDASPSSRWLQRPAAALSPGDSSCPSRPRPTHPRAHPKAKGPARGSWAQPSRLPEGLQLCFLAPWRPENTQIHRMEVK